jgi:hypothetical protein
VSLRDWRWLSDAPLPLALAIQRACWLWLWLELARHWIAPFRPAPLLPATWIIGLSLGSMAMARWALAESKTLTQARAWVTGAGLTIILLVLWLQFYRGQFPLWDVRWPGDLGQALVHPNAETPLLLIVLFTVAYLWLRGLLDGRAALIHDQVWGAFTAGFIALVLFVVVASVDPRELPAGTERVVVLYFVAGMLALTLSSLDMARGSSWHRLDVRFRLNRYSLLTVFLVVLGLVGLGLVLSAVFAPEDVSRMLGWAGGILTAVGQALFTLILILSYLLYLVLYPLLLLLMPLIQWLMALFGIVRRLEPPPVPELGRPLPDMSGPGITLPEPLRWALLAGACLVIAIAFALALQRLRLDAEEDVEETRETILSRELLWDQWTRLWRKWLQRLRQMQTTMLSPFLSLEGEIASRRTIRAIYQALLAGAGARGHRRLRGQTPLEYRQVLEDVLPDAEDALNTVTEGYMQARYGLEPPTGEQVEQTRRAWKRIEVTLEAQE